MKRIETFVNQPLLFKESVTVEVFRGHRGFYLPTPDEQPSTVDLIVNTGRIFLARRIAGGDT